MKRKLTTREIVLLIILLVMAAGSAYYLLFFVPMKDLKESYEMQISDTQSEIEFSQMRIIRMRQMEQELNEIFAENPNPAGMAPYNNRQNVLHELNDILANVNSFSLNFDDLVKGESDSIYRRKISLNFECATYSAAKSVLQQLHDSPYRCLISDLSIDESDPSKEGDDFLGLWWENPEYNASPGASSVSVTATICYFEYQE